jgi:pyridoxamine 5'-phosphate oxidase
VNLAEKYKSKPLDTALIDADPILQLDQWLKEAGHCQCNDNNSFSLATVNSEGKPSNRIVLLKYLNEEGLFFFTNYESRKANDLAMNKKVAACFYWSELERQVRVEGEVHKANHLLSDFYFESRSFESRVSAIVSPQSKKIESREFLIEKWEKQKKEIEDKPLERPDYWGGYFIKPNNFEFWQGRAHRLHDRVVYNKIGPKWDIFRIAP